MIETMRDNQSGDRIAKKEEIDAKLQMVKY